MKASKDLERFLDFLKSAESQLDQAMAGQQEAEAETQDILHSLELEKHSYHEMAALSRKLAEVRQPDGSTRTSSPSSPLWSSGPRKTMAPSAASSACWGICERLSAAHRTGFIHREQMS